MGMAAAMIPFAGCQKNEMEDPNAANGGGSTFELVADVVQTKTTLDASTYKVAWENDDVLYVVTAGEGTPWTAAQEFKYADGKFSTESTIDEGNYTMNVLYAASNQKQYHKNTQTTHKIESVQKQDCTNPTVHIKLNDALAGTFTVNVPQTSTAQVDMHHLYTLMQVNVKNNTDNPVEVTKFEMTAEGADLAGIFNVTSFETPSITAKEGEAPTETITVNVTGGVVDAGYALPVYFVMAPLSDYTGDVTFKVTAADGKTYTKTTAVSNLHFNAGAYNTTPYTISEADVVEPEPEQPEGLKTVTISFANTSQRTSHSNDKQVWENDGVVFTNSKGSSTSNVGDYSNPARFYKSSNIEITAPGNITSISFDCTLSDDLESKHITALAGINGAVQDGNSVVITLEGTSNAFTHNGLSAQARANSVTVVYVSNGSDPGTPTPVINVDTTSPIQVEATAGDSSISYTVGNAVDNITVSATSSEKWLKLGTPTNTSVSFSVSENTGAERTATVTLAYEGAESKTVTVKQAAASQGGGSEGGETTETWTLVTDASTLSVGDKVVIAAAEYNFALSTDQRSNNRNQASITKNSNTITITDDVQVMTLEAGTIASTYAFNTGSGYLYAASSTKNYLKTESSLTANSSWVISIGDNGVATIKAQGTNTRNWLRYNSTNGDPGPIFSCYSSGQSDVSVYRLEGANEGGGETPDPEPDPTPDPEPETPVYASLAELVAAGVPTDEGSKVTVTLDKEEIKSIYISGDYRNGVYLNVGETDILIYCWNVPEPWVVGGTISGTLTNCDWKLYNSTWELCPADWSELTYEAPEGGSTEPEEPAAPVVATVAQFLAAAEDDVVYEITGVITSVDNTEYGNFYLTDSTGEVLIYGLCSPTGEQKYWQTAGVEVGDIITVRTVRTSHQGTPQGKNALYVSDVNFYIDHTEINVTAEQTTAKFDLSVDVGYTIEYPVGVTELSDEHNNDTATTTYTVEFPANEDAEIKTYEIKIVADASFILENPIEGVDYARTVTIKQAAASQGGGAYSVIKSVADLSAGTYLLGGNNKDKYADGTMYMWSNASSVSGQKLKTSAVTFTNGNFDADVSSYVHVELIATAKSNVYYIKLGAKYLKGAVKVWSLVDTPVEWTFADMGGTKDGMYFYNEANASYVFINSTTDAIRTYGNSTKYKGIYLFKAN